MFGIVSFSKEKPCASAAAVLYVSLWIVTLSCFCSRGQLAQILRVFVACDQKRGSETDRQRGGGGKARELEI